jgi:membrane-associated protein
MAGYLFGNIKLIKDNFSTVLLLIIFLSVLPAVISIIQNRFSKEIS